jgi:4-amino-4-deoxy-L-arabinose transferase-like glycosyltransferase
MAVLKLSRCNCRVGRGVLVFLLALLIRLGALHYWPPTDLLYDSSEYMALAYNLRTHGTFGFGSHHAWGENGHWPSGPGQPSTARAPLYPLMIAALWNGENAPNEEVRIAQAVLGASTAAIVYSLGGLAAGIGMALAPMSIFYTTSVMSETLSAFLTTLGVWLWFKRKYWAAGLVLGLATLTKALILPVLMVFALYGIVTRSRKFTAIGVGALLMIAPWIARNYAVSGRLVPVNAYGWSSNIFFSTIDVPYGSGNPWSVYAVDSDTRRIIDSGVSDVDAERQMFTVALRRISDHPLTWTWSRIKNYPRAFIDSGTYLYSLLPFRFVRVSFAIGNLAFLVLTLIGFRREDDYIWMVLLWCFAAQFPSAGGDRYLLPVVSLMMVSATHGWKNLRVLTAAPNPAKRMDLALECQ